MEQIEDQVSDPTDGVGDRGWLPPEAGLWAGMGAVVMFGIALTLGVGVAAVGLIDYTPPVLNTETELEVGQRVFAQNCASCHGSAGEGRVGPALNEGAVVIKYPDPSDHESVVVNGRGGMPSFARQLTAAEIEAVVAYERNGLVTEQR